jgi:hypothetical protein
VCDVGRAEADGDRAQRIGGEGARAGGSRATRARAHAQPRRAPRLHALPVFSRSTYLTTNRAPPLLIFIYTFCYFFTKKATELKIK